MNDENPLSTFVSEHFTSMAFPIAYQRMVEAIEAEGLSVLSVIDHAAGARAAGLQMPDTVVLIYGNARNGTPVMLAWPRAAIELPLRVLVRITESGDTLISFRSVGPALEQCGVPPEIANRFESIQHRIVAHALAHSNANG